MILFYIFLLFCASSILFTYPMGLQLYVVIILIRCIDIKSDSTKIYHNKSKQLRVVEFSVIFQSLKMLIVKTK